MKVGQVTYHFEVVGYDVAIDVDLAGRNIRDLAVKLQDTFIAALPQFKTDLFPSIAIHEHVLALEPDFRVVGASVNKKRYD